MIRIFFLSLFLLGAQSSNAFSWWPFPSFFAEKKDSFEDLLEQQLLNPYDPLINYNLGVLAYKKGNKDLAQASFSRVIDARRDAGEVLYSRSAVNSGNIFARSSTAALDALKWQEKVIPDDVLSDQLADLQRGLERYELVDIGFNTALKLPELKQSIHDFKKLVIERQEQLKKEEKKEQSDQKQKGGSSKNDEKDDNQSSDQKNNENQDQKQDSDNESKPPQNDDQACDKNSQKSHGDNNSDSQNNRNKNPLKNDADNKESEHNNDQSAAEKNAADDNSSAQDNKSESKDEADAADEKKSQEDAEPKPQQDQSAEEKDSEKNNLDDQKSDEQPAKEPEETSKDSGDNGSDDGLKNKLGSDEAESWNQDNNAKNSDSDTQKALADETQDEKKVNHVDDKAVKDGAGIGQNSDEKDAEESYTYWHDEKNKEESAAERMARGLLQKLSKHEAGLQKERLAARAAFSGQRTGLQNNW